MITTLDILIGVSFVMLLTSLAVMLITEALSGLAQLRQRKLKEGLSDLLSLLDSGMSEADRRKAVTDLLDHPTIRQRSTGWTNWLFGGSSGATIHRHEFIRLLLHNSDTDANLARVLKANGIVDAKTILRDIRSRSGHLQLTSPNLPAHTIQDMAILSAAPSDFVYKTHDWFDQIIERVIDRFKQTMRVWSFAVALAVAIGLRLDTIYLVTVLSKDQQTRDKLVTLGTQAAAVEQTSGSLRDVAGQIFALPDVIWGGNNATLLGILLSAALMSLGAPFWYNTLNKLVDLRSRLTVKDAEQRQDREIQTSMPTTSATQQLADPASRPPLTPPPQV